MQRKMASGISIIAIFYIQNKDDFLQGPCLTVEQKAQKVVQNLNLNHELFLEMTDEEITKTFNQNSAFLITLKKKLDEKKTFDETFGILTKYKKCPTCKSLIEKSEGFVLKIELHFHLYQIIHQFT